MSVDPRVEDAIDFHKLSDEAESDQRKQELDEQAFVDDPDGQWPAEIRAARKGGLEGDMAVPARPCLTIDKVSPAIEQVVNQAKNAHLAIKINPRGSKAKQQTAEMLKGLYRNIEHESRAHAARMWALERAAKVGRGYYRILKKYANDGDFDLDLVIAPIENQHSVRLDPSHEMPDGSDSERALITSDLPIKKYRRLYKKNVKGESSELAGLNDESLIGLGTEQPGWVSGDDPKNRVVRVAESFYIDYQTRNLVLGLSRDGQRWIGFDDEVPKGVKVLPKAKGGQERPIDVPSVKWCVVNCLEVLDEQDWEGNFIPIVQVLGKKSNINGKRRYRGIVQKSISAQQSYNVMRSKEMEVIGLASYVPWTVVEGQLEGYEKIWQNAAQKAYPYLTYRNVSLNGTPAGPPQRNTAEPPIQAINISTERASDDIKATTKTFDASLGRTDRRRQSGTAIAELQEQSEQGNSNYLEDLAQISMTHEARIVLGMVKYVYDRPGRIAQILGEDDAPSAVMLNQPFVMGPDGPMPAPAGDKAAEHYDLTQGEYSVTVSVGKSFTTQREEKMLMLGQLAQAAPETVPFWADLWIRSMDFPGKDDIADRLKKMLPPALQEDEHGQQPGIPPEAQAQIAALTQQLEMAMQELQQAKSGIAQAQIKAESAEKIKAAELELKEAIEAQKAELERLKLLVETNLKQKELDAKLAQQAMQAENDERQRQHEADAQAFDAAHGAATHEVDLQHEREMSESEHAHARQLQKEKPQPKPAKGKS